MHINVIALAALISGSATISQAQNYSCSEWEPASLQHRGPVALSLTEEALIWSNGRGIYSASIADSSLGRNTYLDDASVYIVYGNIALDSLDPPLHIVRLFYQSPDFRATRLICEHKS